MVFVFNLTSFPCQQSCVPLEHSAMEKQLQRVSIFLTTPFFLYSANPHATKFAAQSSFCLTLVQETG